MPHLEERTILLTGGSSGIGYCCAEALLRRGARHLVLAGRGGERLAKAASRLGKVTTLELDLASLASIRAAADQLRQSIAAGALPGLFAVVCNAGMLVTRGPMRKTLDGFEITFGTNHLGHFLLVNLLLDIVQSPGRIVFTSSGVHDPDMIEGRFNKPVFTNARELAWPGVSGAPAMSHLQRYATSKLGNLYCAYELARRLRRAGSTVTSNAFDPGAVPTTGLLGDRVIARAIAASPLTRWLGVRVETMQGAGEALAALVADPALESVTGAYFAGRSQRRSSRASYDEAAAAELWRDSAALVGLAESGRIG